MTALPLRQSSPTLYMKGIGNPTQARWALQAPLKLGECSLASIGIQFQLSTSSYLGMTLA